VVVTARFSPINLFWPCNLLMGRGYSGYKNLYYGFLHGRRVGKHWCMYVCVCVCVCVCVYINDTFSGGSPEVRIIST